MAKSGYVRTVEHEGRKYALIWEKMINSDHYQYNVSDLSNGWLEKAFLKFRRKATFQSIILFLIPFLVLSPILFFNNIRSPGLLNCLTIQGFLCYPENN